MRLVSGSPVANEAYDMNVGLMNAEGECIAIGVYISIHALALSGTVKDIAREYATDPGINPGDVFMCNDPYVGACHQMDVTVVAPIFCGEELVAWTGSTVHQIDLGGPVEGQVQIGATSIWGEQPIFPPLKIVDRGALRRDVERAYLRRTRLPDLTGLDLKAMIAGCNVAVERVQALAERYGRDTVVAAIADVGDVAEARFRARLRELPNGTWTHRGYIEYDTVYPGRRLGHQAGRPPDHRLHRERRPGARGDQLHAPGLRGGDRRGGARLSLLRHAVVTGGALSGDRGPHPQRDGGRRRLAGRGLEGDHDRQLHGNDRHRRLSRKDAGRQRPPSRPIHVDVDGRPVRRGRVRDGPTRRVLRRGVPGRDGRRIGSPRARRRARRGGLSRLAVGHHRQRRGLRVQLSGPLSLPPHPVRHGRSGALPRRRHREHVLRAPRRGADPDEDHARDRNAATGLDRSRGRLSVVHQPVRHQACHQHLGAVPGRAHSRRARRDRRGARGVRREHRSHLAGTRGRIPRGGDGRWRLR